MSHSDLLHQLHHFWLHLGRDGILQDLQRHRGRQVLATELCDQDLTSGSRVLQRRQGTWVRVDEGCIRRQSVCVVLDDARGPVLEGLCPVTAAVAVCVVVQGLLCWGSLGREWRRQPPRDPGRRAHSRGSGGSSGGMLTSASTSSSELMICSPRAIDHRLTG